MKKWWWTSNLIYIYRCFFYKFQIEFKTRITFILILLIWFLYHHQYCCLPYCTNRLPTRKGERSGERPREYARKERTQANICRRSCFFILFLELFYYIFILKKQWWKYQYVLKCVDQECRQSNGVCEWVRCHLYVYMHDLELPCRAMLSIFQYVLISILYLLVIFVVCSFCRAIVAVLGVSTIRSSRTAI